MKRCTHDQEEKKKFEEYYKEKYLVKSKKGNGSNLKEIIDAKTLIQILHKVEGQGKMYEKGFEGKKKLLIEEVVLLSKRISDVCEQLFDF